MLIVNEEIVILEAEVQKKENIVKLIAEKLVPIEQAPNEWTNGILICVDADNATTQTLEDIKTIVEKYPGDCNTCLKIQMADQNSDQNSDQENSQAPVLVKFGEEYSTASDPMFFKEIETLIGEGTIETRCAPVKDKQKKKKPWMKKW